MKKLTAADLRVGNIVGRKYMNPTPNGLKKEHEPCQIYSIGIERVIVNSKLNSKGLIKMGYDNIKPIPLTEEWFMRLGGEKTQSNWLVMKVGNYHIYYDGKVLGIDNEVVLGGIVYRAMDGIHIHKLQNIVHSLTSEELTLKDAN